jgi:hypothetical protein
MSLLRSGEWFPSRYRIFLVGLIVALVVVEVGLRLIGYSYTEFYETDLSRGYSLRPGAEGWYRKEGTSFVRINSDGLRDREHTKAKPPDTIRIALLGDSYAEALQVPIEDAFWSVMERQLNLCMSSTGKKIEVINFGVSGYGTAQELITLREHVWDYAPDIILLAVTTNNDITDNSRALKKTEGVPYFLYRDGQLVLDNSFRQSSDLFWRRTKLAMLVEWLYDHSRLMQVTSEAYRGLRTVLGNLRSEFRQVSAAKQASSTPGHETLERSAELGIDNFVYFEPANQVWKDAWRVTEVLIKTMGDEVRSRGANFLVVTLSNGAQVLPWPERRAAFMKTFGIADPFYPDRRIKALGDREGFPVLMLAPDMLDYAQNNKVTLHGVGGNLGFGHWNLTGHQVAGELLGRRLCEGGLVK